MQYLYAIADGVAAVEDLVGIAHEPLRLLSVDSLTVIAGEMANTPLVDRGNLDRQDLLVRRLHDRAEALLPMRFRSTFASETEAQHAITLQASRLLEQLDTVRHREQMAMRVLAATGAPGALGALGAPGALGATGATGTDYLRARAGRQIPSEIGPLLEALHPLVRATRIERGRIAGVIATVYHLIDRGASDTYRTLMEAAASKQPALSIHVSGPSPCYAFA